MTHIKYLFTIIAAVFSSVILVGCGSSGLEKIGIDAIAPNSLRATITERRGGSPEWQLILLDLPENKHYTLAEGFDPEPYFSIGDFSPDGRYVLLHSKDWFLIDTTTEQSVKVNELQPVAKETDWAEFLPDGELLVVSNVNDDLVQFHAIDPTNPQAQPRPLLEQVRYIFWGQGLLTIIRSGLGEDFIGQNFRLCPGLLAPDQKVWTTVDVNGVVSVLKADHNGTSIDTLSNLSATVTDLLERQEDALKSLRRELQDKIEQEVVAAGGEKLSDEEIKRRIEAEFQKEFIGTFNGVPSPDGKKLFFVRTIGPRYTLYLVNLEETGSEEILSSETDWLPAFSFSPDGQQILFQTNIKFDPTYTGERGLYIASADMTTIDRLDVPEDSFPCWHHRSTPISQP